MTVVAAMMCGLVMMAQNPVITFEKTEHDFGKINEGDGRVTTLFHFKNEGMAPLVLSNVRASCGCTTPKWTKEPIEPGQGGDITVTYNPNGRPGRFQKTITVSSNASEPSKKLYIKGEVIPKSAKPVNAYPVKMGELSLKLKDVEFGPVKKGSVITKEVEYANHTNHDLTVAVQQPSMSPELYAPVTLETVEKGKTGKIMVQLDANAIKQYGPYNKKIVVIVNGKKVQTDEYMLNIMADLTEDFGEISTEELQKAPIVEMPAQVDLGKVAKGKVAKGQIMMRNNGMDPLMVRRVYCENKNVKLGHKSSVKNGKEAPVSISIPTTGKNAGVQHEQILVITNDPKNPRQKVNVSYTIE